MYVVNLIRKYKQDFIVIILCGLVLLNILIWGCIVLSLFNGEFQKTWMGLVVAVASFTFTFITMLILEDE